VLADMKSDPDLCTIPIVVLTTSKAHDDVLASYQLHANAYVNKPVDFDRFLSVIQQIDDFYSGLVQLPGHEAVAGG
jgi:CheY-like chemotaxis protein